MAELRITQAGSYVEFEPISETSVGRVVAALLYIDWDFDDVYTDETAYLVSASGSLRYHPPGTGIWSGSGIVDRMVVTLDNSSGRFSPLNSGGALYSDIQDGGAYHAPMYMQVSIDGGSNYYRVFTGVIKIPQETGSSTRETATVTIDCRSNEERILNGRHNTTLAQILAANSDGDTESEYIEGTLNAQGIAAGLQDLDDGQFVIPWGWVDETGDSALEVCWKFAAAAGGRFYADPDGNFVYDNAWAWLVNSNSTSSQATLTTANFQRLQPYYNDTELYKAVTVASYPRDIADSGTLWESSEVYTVPPGQTVVVDAEFDNPSYSISTATYDAPTSGGVNLAASVTLSQTNYAQRASLSFTNAHATQAALVQNIVITGQAIENIDEVSKTVSSADSFWTNRQGRDRTLTGNRWIQSQAQLAYLTEFLSDRHETPRLFFRVAGVRGDPQRRLGDRVTLTDASMSVSSRVAFLTAIDWTYSQSGFVQHYEAVDGTGLYEYLDAATDYFVIGTDTLGAGSSSPGRVFY